MHIVRRAENPPQPKDMSVLLGIAQRVRYEMTPLRTAYRMTSGKL